MNRELNEYIMLERVEMIARLTAEGGCQERDREIALNLIAEIARANLLENSTPPPGFAVRAAKEKVKSAGVRVSITIDKDQQIGQSVIDAFQCELTRRIQSVFPLINVIVKKGAATGVELSGLDKESDREALDTILQEVWEDEGWR